MNLYKRWWLMICGICLLAAACKKDNYLTDGGLHGARTPLTVYDYLKQNSFRLFDTLIMIVDHYQLQEEINHTGTFFAPTNYSINAYMNLQKAIKRQKDENAQYTMDSLYRDMTADSLRQYLFREKLPVSGFTDEQPRVLTNMAGITCAVRKQKTTDQAYYQWSSEPVYFLYYIKIIGGLDPPGSTPDPNEADVSAVCQTTGIETESGNGPLLHVLGNRHIFIRF